jgi:hypothetical protein
MKTTRSFEFLWRLTKWRELYFDLRRQPLIAFVEEISVGEAQRRFGHLAPANAVGVKIGYTVYAPLEAEVDPHR